LCAFDARDLGSLCNQVVSVPYVWPAKDVCDRISGAPDPDRGAPGAGHEKIPGRAPVVPPGT